VSISVKIFVLVTTLVQLLKDIDNPNEIIEYIRPYMGCISKAKEFADNFLFKRNQFSNVDPEQMTDVFIESDDGFQLATSHTHKKKSKKLKGQKLGIRDDIDQIPM